MTSKDAGIESSADRQMESSAEIADARVAETKKDVWRAEPRRGSNGRPEAMRVVKKISDEVGRKKSRVARYWNRDGSEGRCNDFFCTKSGCRATKFGKREAEEDESGSLKLDGKLPVETERGKTEVRILRRDICPD